MAYLPIVVTRGGKCAGGGCVHCGWQEGGVRAGRGSSAWGSMRTVYAKKMRAVYPLLVDVLLTPQLAGITCSDLGAVAGNLAGSRDTILAALDFLLTGYS